MVCCVLFQLFLVSCLSWVGASRNFEVLSRSDLPSCGATVDNGRVDMPVCKDKVFIASLLGKKLIDCKVLADYSFIGPVYLRTDDCDQTVVTLDKCGDTPFDATVLSRPCRSDMHHKTVLLCMLMVLFVYLQIVAFRYVYLFYSYRRKGSKLTNVVKSGNSFKFSMYKRVHPEGGRLTEAGVRELGPRLLEQSTSFTMSVCQVAVFCLLMVNPVHSNVGDFTILVEPNMTMHERGFSLESGDLFSSMPLTFEFSTSEVSASYTEETKFLESDCSGCLSLLARPKRMSRLVTRVVSSGKSTFDIKTCLPLATGVHFFDILTDACKMRMYTFEWPTRSEWRVFSISEGVIQGDVDLTGQGCSMKDVDELLPLRIPGSVVSPPDGTVHYCPGEVIMDVPSTGSIGTLRVMSNGFFQIPPEFMTCTSSARDLNCFRHNYGVDSLLERCVRLPASFQGLKLSVRRGRLEVRRSPSRRIRVSCPLIAAAENKCGQLIAEAAGVKEGTKGLIVRYKTEVVADSSWTGLIPCLGDNFTIPCDGEGLTVVTNMGSECLESIPDSRVHILDPSDISLDTVDGIGLNPWHTDSDSPINNMRAFVGDKILGLVMASPLFTILGIMILCKMSK